MPEIQLENISRKLKDLHQQYLTVDLRPHLQVIFKTGENFRTAANAGQKTQVGPTRGR